MTQQILDSEELTQFMNKDEEGQRADQKAHEDISRKFVKEFRSFLERRKN